MSRKAVNIQWDTYDAEYDEEYGAEDEKLEELNLPQEIDIPDDVDDEDVGDYISDLTGFCHYGFVIESE